MEAADSKDSAAGLPDLVGVAFGLLVQANYSAAGLTRHAAAELEMVLLVTGEGDENGDRGWHTVQGEQEGEGLCVLG